MSPNADFSRLDCGCIVYEDGKRISCSQHRQEHPPYIPEADQPTVRKTKESSLIDKFRQSAAKQMSLPLAEANDPWKVKALGRLAWQQKLLLEAADRIDELEAYIDDIHNERSANAERRSVL